MMTKKIVFISCDVSFVQIKVVKVKTFNLNGNISEIKNHRDFKLRQYLKRADLPPFSNRTANIYLIIYYIQFFIKRYHIIYAHLHAYAYT